MSKNRNKKTPMFVSTIPTAYDFVDYTVPGEQKSNSNAFGNPNPAPPVQSVPQNQPFKQSFDQILNQPPKKAENNWFESMLTSTQTSKPKTSSYQIPSQQPKVQAYQYSSTSNYSISTNSPPKAQKSATQRLNYAQPSYGKSNNYSSDFQTNQQTFSSQTTVSPQKLDYFGDKKQQVGSYQQIPNFSKNQNAYQFRSTKNQIINENKYGGYSSTNRDKSSQNYSFDEVKPTKIKTQPANNYSSSSSGFTDESLINSLPQPARSNILAIIKRSKGLSQ